MSESFVVCPNCGATVVAPIKVDSVRVDSTRLLVHYTTVFVDHVCEARA